MMRVSRLLTQIGWTPMAVLCVAVLLSGKPGWGAPRVLFRHSFDRPAVDYGRDFRVSISRDVSFRKPAIRGQAAWFAESAAAAKLRIELPKNALSSAWTIALWEIVEVKAWLTAPNDNLLTLVDKNDQPIITLSKSGTLFVFDVSGGVQLRCFDALYWVRGSREHLALTWDPSGSGVKQPRGMLRAYWKARPYASLAVDLKRVPVAMVIGGPRAGLGVDELFVFDGALSQRGLWELMRAKDTNINRLLQRLQRQELRESQRPAAIRDAAWGNLVRQGMLVEAEQHAGKGKLVSSRPNQSTLAKKVLNVSRNNAATASGRACVEPGRGELEFRFRVKAAGKYSLALRYCLQRRMHPLWPQNSSAKTPWSENATLVEVHVDGRKLSGLKLFPTGTYSGHSGDVEMWAWQSIQTQPQQLSAGDHVVRVRFVKGLAQPIYDALLVSQKTGPQPPHRRWVDRYRIPPAWWVADHQTRSAGGKREDIYTVTLRNRCDEPCSYQIVVGDEKLKHQQASASLRSIRLLPFEEKSFQVTFRASRSLTNNCEWANIYLWNDDVSLRQKYRLWNLIPNATATSVAHPVLVPKPDLRLQRALRRWLVKRDLNARTKELRNWIRARNIRIGEGLARVRAFPREFSGDRLAALDAWMKLNERDMEQFLPDGPAEFNGYGSGWERTGVEYAGVWHKMPKVTGIHPLGDIDSVTSLTVGGPPQKGKTKPYSKTYTATRDLNLIGCVRDTRWRSMLGFGFYGAAPYRHPTRGDMPLGRKQHTGIPLMAEAYYLTGNKAYAQKAYQMLRVFARKYTGLTKHFYFNLHREDRDWWGGRIGGRYLSKFGPRHYQAMGVYVLDLIWDALTPTQRTIVEHNVLRWGMYEGMSGPLFEVPEYFAAVNREDMPYLALARVLGDPAPRQGLQFFYDLFKDVVLPDGIHQCSIGSYGGVSSYVTFLQKLHQLGLDVAKNPALRNCFQAHPSFIFSGGGLPNIDDGGGVNLHGLGAGFGSPSPAQYKWAKKLLGDPALDDWPKLIAAAQRAVNAGPKAKVATLRNVYLSPAGKRLVNRYWPPVYIAPIKGLAMLRNRFSSEPIDWVEVIFDYGRFGGRSHGQAAKLATIPSFNGQIVSMEYGYGSHGKPVATGFHMRSYAHNVVVVDGKNQFSASGAVPVGKLRESYARPKIQWVDAESTRIYDGVYMRRTVFTTDFGIVDIYTCRSDKTRQYDWMFHSFGVASSSQKLHRVARLAKSGPLTFARNPQSLTTNDLIQVTWKNSPLSKPRRKASTALLHEDAFVRVWCLPARQTTVSLFGIEMVKDVGGEIDYMMVRRKAASTVFATVQEPWRASTKSKVAQVKQLLIPAPFRPIPDTAAYALQVTRHDGSHMVFLVNSTGATHTLGRVTTNAAVAAWTITKDGTVGDFHHSAKARLEVK